MTLNCYQLCHYRYDEIVTEGETFRVNVEYFINDIRRGAEPVKTIELVGETSLLNLVGTRELELEPTCERLHIQYLLFKRIINTEKSVIQTNQEIAIQQAHLALVYNEYMRNNIIYGAYIDSTMNGYPFRVPDINLPLLR